ncbi:hypothetical protein JM79_2463 [Gramella sp. Hel_I_59]|uniref:glycosyltransferase family 2 protein n=1 Tax=Gramella sp. Hel_I_59 TaxID=1249978 RepID=UPI00114FEF36|nr:glycosyltransferase family A protein [Gramella sp. Hel_I_59]TQI71523.1 hypothetical protein JM79_2463 [Gramella sp. Hel_I_59]
MKILIHRHAGQLIDILSIGGDSIPVGSLNCISAFWYLAKEYPEELILWCEERIYKDLNLEEINKIFHHDLIMASYAVYSEYLPRAVGYIDHMPYVNVNRNVSYGTWFMSTDVGGIKGNTLLKFKHFFSKESDFGFLLNSIAKIGLENGLFCYSVPSLIVNREIPLVKKINADNSDLFRFVYSHYTTIWTTILFFCFISKEKNIPIKSYISAFFNSKKFKKEIDLRDLPIKSTQLSQLSNNIDVILPTIGRTEQVKQVLNDLRNQSLTPYQVILIEQKPGEDHTSDLQGLVKEKWPFQLVHIFTQRTGVCYARNLGLEKVISDWVFLCDDDNRIASSVLSDALSEIRRLGVNMINTAYRQPDENIIFKKIKQWGTFGAGNSIVKSEFLENVRFSNTFEHGYGEDKDFGMQLRNRGCDIIYDPFLEITHLKAPMGGFRIKKVFKWEAESPQPKPSPTVMALILKYYTLEQRYGYKLSMFLKFYRKQTIKNPIAYFKIMNKSWDKSLYWGKYLLDQS